MLITLLKREIHVQFLKAERKRAKLRLALAGPSGSGKTYGALLIAKGLGGRVAVIDTEHGSASLYADLLDYDTLELTPPYSPERYIEAIRAAESAGYDVIVIDSTSHEWEGSGGCLESNETLARAKYRGNTWSAWSDTTPRHRAFIDAQLQSRCHIIATMRSKTATEQAEENGKKKVVKLGMKAVQREGAEYEYTVVLDLEHEHHFAVASKDRTRLFAEPHIVTEETGKRLLAWLESGAEPAPQARLTLGDDEGTNARLVMAGKAAGLGSREIIRWVQAQPWGAGVTGWSAIPVDHADDVQQYIIANAKQEVTE